MAESATQVQDYFHSTKYSTESQLSWRASNLRQSEPLANPENKSSIRLKDRILNLIVILSHNLADTVRFYNESALKSINV